MSDIPSHGHPSTWDDHGYHDAAEVVADREMIYDALSNMRRFGFFTESDRERLERLIAKYKPE